MFYDFFQIKDLDEERRKREHDTAQGDDITYCLEKDRTNLKQVRKYLSNLNILTRTDFRLLRKVSS